MSDTISPIEKARGNGYTDDQINDYLTPRITAARGAGYSEDQINQYLGIKTPPPFDGSSVHTMGTAGLQLKPVSTFEDALKAGWGMSVTGLSFDAPDKTIDENAPATSRMAFNLAQLTGDLPAFLAGGLAGGGATIETGPGAIIGAGAGAMALPTALRGLMMDSYAKGQFHSFGDFWERVAPIMADTAKSYITGAATAGVGIGARAVLPAALPGVLRTTGVTTAELATMVTVGKALEGEMPRARDFGDAAVMLGGMKFAEFGGAKLRNIFTKTGVSPARVVQDAAQDVTVQQDLLSGREIPQRYEGLMDPGGDAPFPESPPLSREATPEPPEHLGEAPAAGEPGLSTPGAKPFLIEPAEPQRLASWLIANGGVREPGGDVRSSMGGYRGRPGLISNSGRTLDDAALNAWESGYFPNHSERPSINELLDAIDEDLKGNPQYSHHNEGAVANYQDARAQNAEVLRLASEVGLPTKDMTRDQFLDTLASHLTPEDFDARVGAEEQRAATLYEDAERGAAAWVAHHGTPHTFDRFDTSKIGTGEGAQAYGHGLYFAENPAVAGSYKTAGAGPTLINAALDAAKERGLTGAEATSFVKDYVERERKNVGNLLTVRINAKPEEMLDWDKPLSEQPEIVQKLRDAGIPTGNALEHQTGELLHDALLHYDTEANPKTGMPDPAALAKRLREAGIRGIRYLDRDSREPKVSISLDGARYKLPGDRGDPERDLPEAKAMRRVIENGGDIGQALRELDAAGWLGAAAWLRRVQQEGRIGVEKEQGTHNVVLFDHSDVEITHRNGEAVEPHAPTPTEAHELEGQEPHGGFDAEHFYGANQGRSLEDLENDYRSEAATPAAGERAGGIEAGGPPSGTAGALPGGVQPGGPGAGAARGEEPTPAGRSAIPTVGRAEAGGAEPSRPDGAEPGAAERVNPWASSPTEEAASPFVNPWEARPVAGEELPLEGGGGGRYGGTPPPTPPAGGEPELPLPPRPMTPEEARASILSHLSIGESPPGRPWTFSRIYTDLFDRFFPIQQVVTRVAGRDVLATADDPAKMARMMAGATGIADRFSNYNTLDFNTRQPNGEGLRPILARVSDNMDGFRAYIAAEHALELESQGIRTGFDLDAARHVVADGAGQFAEPASALYDYSNRVAAYLRDGGVLSQAGYEEMTQRWLAYVPFQRVMDQTVGGNIRERVSSSLQARQMIHGIEGSQRVVIDPIESIIRNTYLYTHMAERNVVGTKLIDMLRPHDEAEATASATAAAHEGLDALADAGQPPKPDEIRIFRDGRPETYRVDPELAIAMKGLDMPNMGILERLLRPLSQVLRAGAVLNPDFMLRHTIRDFLYASVTHPDGFTPQMMLKGMMSEIGRGQEYQEWLSSGGANVSMVSMDRGHLQMTLDHLTETGLTQRAWNVVADPYETPLTRAGAAAGLPVQAFRQYVLSPLQFGVSLVENASHLGTFIEARKAMLAQMPEGSALNREQTLEAGYQSRDVAVDAARMGSKIRAFNAIKAFANIALQDSDRVVRAFIDKPMTTAVKVAGAIVLPSVLVWNSGKDDPRYEDAPLWERDLFWVIPTDRWQPATQQETIGLPQYLVRSVDGGLEVNRGATFRIPKPWGMGLIFGSGTERLLDGFVAGRPHVGREFLHSMAEVSVPIGFPDALVPIIEQIANRSLFRKRTLVPSEMEKNLPEYQYTAYTTETAKALGQMIGAFPGVDAVSDGPLGGTARALTSPILLENYLRGWTGNLGVYALHAADLGLRKAGVLPDPIMPASTLADIPVVKAFVVRYPGSSVESIQEFNDAYDHNKVAFDTWKRMATEGNTEAMDRIRKTEGFPIAGAEMTPENAMMIGMGRKPITFDVDAEKQLTSPVIRHAVGTRAAADLSATRAQVTGQRVNDYNGPITLAQMADIRSVMTEHTQLIRDIYKNQDIPAGEKRQLIDTVYYRMQELAQIGMAGVRRAEKASSGMTVEPAYRIIGAPGETVH